MHTQLKTHTLALVALMAAVMAVLSPISVPVGVVPFSLGVFAVYLTAAMLPPLPALASLSVYILLGAVGLPVFSNYRGGPQVLVGLTGGYIAGYFIVVCLVSLVCAKTQSFSVRMGVSAGALLLFYIVGTLWYAFVAQTTFAAGLMVCVVPFFIPDLIKAALALALAAVLRRRLEKVR